jgi:hypothetical protein
MLHRISGVSTSYQSLRAFLEAIGMAPLTSRVGWGIALLIVLAGNMALAILVTAIVRIFIGW